MSGKKSAKQWLWYLLVLVVVLLFLLPWLVWLTGPVKTLEVAILDKTVPDRTYREHKGLVWLLNHHKYRQRSGSPYHYRTGYFGFHPLEGEQYRVDSLPDTLRTPDVMYVADTYGVYTADFFKRNKKGKRSRKIYGGLTEKETRILERFVLEGSLLIGEFNCFASPTGSGARAAMTQLLGVEWTGWIGRHFNDLDSSIEVAEWMVRNYRNQTGEDWNFTGPGHVLVHESDSIVVLERGKHITSDACEFNLTSLGSSYFRKDLHAEYHYWFDIVQPDSGTDVLAYFRLDVTEEGRQLLGQHRIPARFPAVTRRKTQKRPAWYFAGDFSDVLQIGRFHRLWGLDRFKRILHRNSELQNSFFWQVQAPMLKRIFKSEYLAREREGAGPELKR